MSQIMKSHFETLKYIFGNSSNIELFNDLPEVTKYEITTVFAVGRRTILALKKAKFSITRIQVISNNKIEILVEIKETLN